MKLHIQHYLIVCLLKAIQISLVYSTCNLTPQVKFPEGKKENKRLEGYAVVNTTAETAKSCFAKCVENCRCKSINVCGNTCQLNSGTTTDKTLTDYTDCSYFELSWEQQNSVSDTARCVEPRGCCNTSNTCLNGGTCIEQCPTSSTERYRCICLEHLGIRGKRCEIAPKSCRAIYDVMPNSQSGVYTLFDDLGESFPAYCDFTRHDGKVWTLVQSFSLGNVGLYQKSQLFKDNPRNIENPESWEDYRLSKARFSSIQKNSTHFRITCNYNGQSYADMVDYMRLKNDVVDFLTYNTDDVTDKCTLVEYLNIRGGSCTDCTLAIVQSSAWNIFTNPSRNIAYGCDWNYPNGHASCEENLGGYECYHPDYRCTTSSTSTTNTWYGS